MREKSGQYLILNVRDDVRCFECSFCLGERLLDDFDNASKQSFEPSLRFLSPTRSHLHEPNISHELFIHNTKSSASLHFKQ